VTSTLIIEGLRVEVAGKEVLRGFDLLMRTGEVHVIMGPNGSGKSTLAHALTGHPGYKVLGGSVRIDDVELLTMSPSERARHGLLLAMQQPLEVAGVRPIDLLIAAGVDPTNLRQRMRDEAERVELRPEILDRFVNVDLSGGERKRAEMVQFGCCVQSSRCSMRLTRVLTLTHWVRSLVDCHSRATSGVRHLGDHAFQATVARAHADDDPRAE